MSKLDQQRDLQARIEQLRADKTDLEQAIRVARTDLDKFLVQNGDVIALEKRQKEYHQVQIRSEQIRSTPEFQEWRKHFLSFKNPCWNPELEIWEERG